MAGHFCTTLSLLTVDDCSLFSGFDPTGFVQILRPRVSGGFLTPLLPYSKDPADIYLRLMLFALELRFSPLQGLTSCSHDRCGASFSPPVILNSPSSDDPPSARHLIEPHI